MALSGCSTKEPTISKKDVVNNTPIVKNIPTTNNVPVIKVPNDKVVNIGETVKLHATVLNKNKNDSLTYQWRIAAKPKASELSLNNTSQTDISFKVDKKGKYYLDFIAKNGQARSKAERVIITVQSILGEWTANLSKTKEESKLNESETAELVETLSANYKLAFLENGKVEGDDERSWTYTKNGNYQLNDSQKIKVINQNELYIMSKLESGKELNFYYKRALKK